MAKRTQPDTQRDNDEGGTVRADCSAEGTSGVSVFHNHGCASTLRNVYAWSDEERAALVALLRVRPDGLNWAQITAEVADCNSAIAVWNRLKPPALFDSSDEVDEALAAAALEIAQWKNEDFRFLTFKDVDYPAQLREVHQMPPLLFTKGSLLADDSAISVVGSRKASKFAMKISGEIAHRLVDEGLTVLSGLAEGIDSAAHRAALAANGRTVAVIGTGIRKYFPSFNKQLQDQIARNGLVISQFWPDGPPTKQSFPMRNATMSAYGKATVIVEAGEQSGARIQARAAVAHGRPVILLDSVVRGTNWGSRMVNQPGVYVAETSQQAVEHVRDVIASENRLDRLLSSLVSGW